MPDFIGIDPGLKGATALITDGKLYIWDMPVLEFVLKNKKKRREIHIGELVRILRISGDATVGYLEHLWGLPGQGSTGFTQGENYGMIKASLLFSSVPYTLVTPQKWKKYFGLTKDKDASRELASKLFPARADMFKRKKDDGRAEAALIAQYGLEQSGLLS